MKLKIALLTAAVLVGIASTSGPTAHPDSISMDRSPNQDNSVGDFTAPKPCELNCYLPLRKCVQGCGGGSSCEHKCNCELFGDPKVACRTRGCVPAPENCPAQKEDLTPPYTLDEFGWRKRVILERDITTDQSMTNSDDVNETLSLAEASGSVTDNAVGVKEQGVPPLNPCLLCTYAINACKQQCQTPGACDAACACHEKATNVDCLGCGAKCHCGHSCPALSQMLRRDNELPSNSGGPPQQTNMVESIDIDTTKSDQLDTAAQNIPGPVRACTSCQFAINFCKQACHTPGACDDSCACYHKMRGGNCKECKINCSCGHLCPSLARKLHRDTELPGGIDELQDQPRAIKITHLDTPKDLPVKAARSELSHPVPPASPPPCSHCYESIVKCQKRECEAPGKCDDACACYHAKENPSCKNCRVKCHCGHLCPSLAKLLRRDDEMLDESTLSGLAIGDREDDYVKKA